MEVKKTLFVREVINLTTTELIKRDINAHSARNHICPRNLRRKYLMVAKLFKFYKKINSNISFYRVKIIFIKY